MFCCAAWTGRDRGVRRCQCVDYGDVLLLLLLLLLLLCEQAATVDNQATVIPAQLLQPPSLPRPARSETDMNLAVCEEPAVTTHSGRSHRLPSLPTQQLDGQMDNTPAAATRQRSSAADQVVLFFSRPR